MVLRSEYGLINITSTTSPDLHLNWCNLLLLTGSPVFIFTLCRLWLISQPLGSIMRYQMRWFLCIKAYNNFLSLRLEIRVFFMTVSSHINSSLFTFSIISHGLCSIISGHSPFRPVCSWNMFNILLPFSVVPIIPFARSSVCGFLLPIFHILVNSHLLREHYTIFHFYLIITIHPFTFPPLSIPGSFYL